MHRVLTDILIRLNFLLFNLLVKRQEESRDLINKLFILNNY